MDVTEDNIRELIACRDLDVFCAKINYHPLKIVFDLKQIMYPSRSDMLVYMLWSIIYNNDKTYFIIENSKEQCISTMGEFYYLADMLPIWMQPEPGYHRQTYAEFINGCKLQVISNSSNLRGWSVSGAMISTDIVGNKALKLRDNLIPAIVCGRPIIEFNNGPEYTWASNEET